jgi:hypothetical protein
MMIIVSVSGIDLAAFDPGVMIRPRYLDVSSPARVWALSIPPSLRWTILKHGVQRIFNRRAQRGDCRGTRSPRLGEWNPAAR